MMPLDGDAAAKSTSSNARPDRIPVLAFVTDATSEAVLREALSDFLPVGIEFRRAGIRAATAILARMPTPQTVILDVSGEENPLLALADLSQVVEPDVRVLVVGDREDVNFYRQVTRGLGVLEYLYKPLVRDTVARHFGALFNRAAVQPEAGKGGRIVTLTGVRGGVGASTISANLAWYLGVEARRHTVLLDTDLHRGTCAMLLSAKSGSGLRTALETPSRVDELFIERAAQPVAERMHVLAGEEQLVEQPAYAPEAAARIAIALRRRYNFVITDLPFTGQALHRDLMLLAQQRVLVMLPTLASIRDVLRLLALPNASGQPRRAVVVLNRAGMPGGLDLRHVTDALKMPPDIVIADCKRTVERAATLGQPAAQERGGFRSGVIALAREVGFSRADVGVAPVRKLFRWRR